VILHYFSSAGWREWGLSDRPLIREAMPVLIDEDLCFEDAAVLRPAAVMNLWLRELPVSGAPSPKSWRTYAQALKAGRSSSMPAGSRSSLIGSGFGMRCPCMPGTGCRVRWR